MSFLSKKKKSFINILKSIDYEKKALRCAQLLKNSNLLNEKIIFLGNAVWGGGTSIASHVSADFTKNVKIR